MTKFNRDLKKSPCTPTKSLHQQNAKTELFDDKGERVGAEYFSYE